MHAYEVAIKVVIAAGGIDINLAERTYLPSHGRRAAGCSCGCMPVKEDAKIFVATTFAASFFKAEEREFSHPRYPHCVHLFKR